MTTSQDSPNCPIRRALRRLLPSLAAWVAMLLAPSPAAAWWEYGHETVGEIAMRVIQPRTRAAVRDILRHSAALETPTCPAATIAQAAVWPDCVKTLGDRFSYQSSWHYQDPEICAPFTVKADCAGAELVSRCRSRARSGWWRIASCRGAIGRRRSLISSTSSAISISRFTPPPTTAIRAATSSRRITGPCRRATSTPSGTACWPSVRSARRRRAPSGSLSEVPADRRAALAGGTVDDWGRESWALARSAVYGSLEADPCGPEPNAAIVMDAATAARLVPVVRLQIARAGLRLGRLLDAALDGDHPEIAHPPRPPRAAAPAA